MAGIIYEVIEGVHKDRIATVSNKQESKVLSAGKVHAYFFDAEHNPVLRDGKHVNGLISLDKLKQKGFYD